MKKIVLLLIICISILTLLGSGCSGSSGASDGTAGTDGTDGTDGIDGTDDSSGNTDNEPTITATVVANQNNVLSVYVDWTTETPMDSEVQFGVNGYQFRIHDNTAVMDHRILVIGMHAETTYRIRATSSNNDRTLQDETTWTTGSLPVGIPEGVMLTNNTALSQPGWTLMNVQVGNGSFAFSDYPARVVMYDNDGLPVWYYIHGPNNDRGGALSTEFLDSDTILIGPTGVPPNDVPPAATRTLPFSRRLASPQ